MIEIANDSDYRDDEGWSQFLRDCDEHEVELCVTYKDGLKSTGKIKWEAILKMAINHNKCAVAEIYKQILQNKY